MARFFSEQEIDTSLILSLDVAIIGYGNQGHAHALNLRDSGVRVVVGSYEGSKSGAAASSAGFEVVPIAAAVGAADVVMLTLPDVPMRGIYQREVLPNLSAGHTLLFAHGFNIHYDLIKPPVGVDVALVSPKGAGAKLRAEYRAGRGLAALIAVHQDTSGSALKMALSYGWAIGSARALLMETTFREETETDLFGEQAVLCGGIPELLKAAYDTLVEAGYQPEAAYFECIHEAKLITDLIYARGLTGMRSAISDTAEWGGFTAGPKVVGWEARDAMKTLIGEIQSGAFTKKWIEEDAAKRPQLESYRAEEAKYPAESVGAELRNRMSIGPEL
jgi:ketol-acid reductoisomerase